MYKNLGIKIGKKVLVILLISLIAEIAIMFYNKVIYKVYTDLHLIGNESIELSKQDLDIETEDGVTNIKIKDISDTKIYNIALILNSKNASVYMRVIMNNDAKFMPKENAKGTKFKVYYFEGTTTDKFEINYGENSVDTKNIEKVIINEDIDYLPQRGFSYKNFLIIAGILIISALIMELYKLSKNREIKIKKEFLFLVASVIIGVSFIFINVPQIRYDEHAHFWRVYEIASGNIISRTTNKLPESIVDLFRRKDGSYPNQEFKYNTIQEKIKDSLNVEENIIFPVGATGSLTPISYIPQVVGAIIGNLLKLSPIIILWLSRLTNLLCYIILVFLAIKIMPFEKWKSIIMIIALFPMSMNLSATVSPDTVIIGATLLAISYVFYLKEVKKKISILNIVLLAILFMIPTVCKIVYFPLCLLVFILPKEKIDGKAKKILYYVLTFSIVLGFYFVFNQLVAAGDYAIAIRSNMTEQILFTMSDLARDFGTAVNTFYSESSNYFFEMIGGWNTTKIVSVAIFIILLFVMYENDKGNKQYIFSRKEKNIFITIIVIEILGVIAAMYLGWTQGRQTIVEGVQGRYFLPILPLLCMLISRNKIDFNIKNKMLKFIIILIVAYISIFVFSIKFYL